MGKGEGRGKFYGGWFGGYFMNVGREICGCICCMIFAGPICIIIGIVMFSNAASNPRGSSISQWNTALTNWNGPGKDSYSQFGQVNNISIGSDLDNTSVLLIKDISAVDSLADTGQDFTNTWSQVRFKGQGKLLLPKAFNLATKPTISVFVNGVKSLLSNLVLFKNTTFYPSDTSLSCGYRQCTDRNGNTVNCQPLQANPSCPSMCINIGGYWDYVALTCTISSYLTSLCVKVGYDTTTQGYILTTIPGSDYGCSYTAKNTGTNCLSSNTNWSPSSFSCGPSNYSSISFNTVSIQVKDTNDPYVQASYITDGTYSFGPTASQYASTGLIFLIIGIVFLLPIIAFFVWLCRRNKNQSTVVTTTTMNYAPPPLTYAQHPYGQPGYAPNPYGQPGYAPNPYGQPPPY